MLIALALVAQPVLSAGVMVCDCHGRDGEQGEQHAWPDQFVSADNMMSGPLDASACCSAAAWERDEHAPVNAPSPSGDCDCPGPCCAAQMNHPLSHLHGDAFQLDLPASQYLGCFTGGPPPSATLGLLVPPPQADDLD